MAELTPPPIAACCSTETQTTCCEPQDKEGCCAPQSTSETACGCAVGVTDSQGNALSRPLVASSVASRS